MIWKDVALPLADVLGCARIEGAPASLNLLEAANTVLTPLHLCEDPITNTHRIRSRCGNWLSPMLGIVPMDRAG